MKQIFTKLIPKFFARSLNGKSAEILYDKAEKLHKKANELFKLGYNHPKEYNAAFELYKKAADQGLAEAQCKLGVCYYYGKGIKKSSSEAIKWYQKAIEQGNAEALYYLGRCYYDGKGVFKNYSQTVEYMKKAATLGYAKAQYELSMCYYYGNGVEKDYAESLKWIIQAAENGYIKAQRKLALCYCGSEHTSLNDAKNKHNDYNNIPQYNIKQNYEQAFKYFSLAAEQSDGYASYMLGECYYNGYGVEKNYDTALKWFQTAAEQGSLNAKDKLIKLGES